MEAGSASDIGAFRRAFDAACEELGLKVPGLDVATRELLVARILSLLETARSR
jgi:hypothetical protein